MPVYSRDVMNPLDHLSTIDRYRLSGYVFGPEGEPLEGAAVVISPGNITILTDKQGYFQVDLKGGSYRVECRYISMIRFRREVSLSSDVQLIFHMTQSNFNLGEVVVTARPTQDLNSLSTGSSYMDLHSLNNLPSFLGQTDVIRSITTLPGVVSSGEAASGFYVRGGGADQNLILLDEVPLFNSSHLFGFFSVFNPSVLSGYTLSRTGGSARYGGRISSVLDVRIKNGNPDQMNYSGEISPVTLNLEMDGPLSSKTSLVLAGRLANPDYILRLFPDPDIRSSRGSFYDGNVKVSHSFSGKDNIDLSAYWSLDQFKFPYDTVYQWANYLGRLKWNHLYNRNLSSNLSVSKSLYRNVTDGITPGKEYRYFTGINYTGIRIDFDYVRKEKQDMEFGSGIENYIIQPGRLVPEDPAYNPARLQIDRGSELYLYANDQIIINKRISAGIGLRGTYYMNYGPSQTYLYQAGLPKSYLTITDTLYYGKGDVTKSYSGLEPIISFKYSLGETSSLKASYDHTGQYIQIISNTASITPVDVWKLSNRYIKPQTADQLSAGYFYISSLKTYEFSWEIYYKFLHNQVDYKDGALLVLNPLIEPELLFGRGFAYGSEWFLKKNSGPITGWFSLSLSKSYRIIKGSAPEEMINDGKAYPSNFDKPFNFDLFMNYKFPNSRWTFSANANYTTGRPITAADSWFQYAGQIFSNYSGRNQERMPDYQRIDLSLNRDSNPNKKIKTTWGISVYNLFFRKNAYSAFYKHYYGSIPGAYKLAIIGIAVPSVSFGMKF